jgi:hypothetical protein
MASRLGIEEDVRLKPDATIEEDVRLKPDATIWP